MRTSDKRQRREYTRRDVLVTKQAQQAHLVALCVWVQGGRPARGLSCFGVVVCGSRKAKQQKEARSETWPER